jgi:RNA polymerase sigma-70 factor, ECF subfamily
MRHPRRPPTSTVMPPPEPALSTAEHHTAGSTRSGATQLAAVQADDSETFGDLYLQHAQTVYTVCGRRSGDWQSAEDLTSIVFLEAWRTRAHAFASDDGSMLPWLVGIARNVTAMSRRSLGRYQATVARFAARTSTDATSSDNVEDAAIRTGNQPFVLGAISNALHALPRDQRAVVELCLVNGRTPQEAAITLGIPISTMISRLDYGRQRLRRLLRSSEVDQPSWLIGNTQVSAEPAPPTTRGRDLTS